MYVLINAPAKLILAHGTFPVCRTNQELSLATCRQLFAKVVGARCNLAKTLRASAVSNALNKPMADERARFGPTGFCGRVTGSKIPNVRSSIWLRSNMSKIVPGIREQRNQLLIHFLHNLRVRVFERDHELDHIASLIRRYIWPNSTATFSPRRNS